MLKSKARGRIARRAAAAGAVSAGVLLGGLCAVGANADTKTVTYTCTPGSGSTATAYTGAFNVSLLTAVATATVGTQFTATLAIEPAATATLPAPTAIGTGKALQLVPSVVATVSPATATAAVGTPTATAPVASMTAGAPLTALPTATITITPSTGATSIVLTAKDFKLNLVDAAATGTGTATPLYTCLIATTGNTLPAVATIPVGTGSASASTSASTTPTPTASTPRPTRTVYETVTAKPSTTRSRQVTHTPGGGAATGGGGEMGPDGRVLVLTGTGLMLAAATGGLMIRARRRPVRH